MNKEQTEALMLYCNMTFGHRNVSVVECLNRLDNDARDLNLTRMQYLDYIIIQYINYVVANSILLE